MKFVFLGTPESAVTSLDALLAAGHTATLVVTRPDRPAGRSGTPQAPPVKQWAVTRGIPVLQPVKVRGPGFLEALREHAPELLVVVAYGKILPRAVLEVAPHGAINLHFSLLPRYRGAAPVQWALARGETQTGVTTMQISERLDEGDILLQREVGIEPGEHAPALQRRLAEIGASLLVETVARLREGMLTPRPQDHGQASFAPLLSTADGEADLSLPAPEIEGRIRGFDPWPGVWALCKGKRLRLVEGEVLPGPSSVEGPPGRVLEWADEALVLACGNGTCLALRKLQVEGRRVLSARDAVNGRVLVPGDRLEWESTS